MNETALEKPYADVAVTLPMAHSFVYAVPESLAADCIPGMRVLVPFGRRRITGYILKRRTDCGKYRAKKILDVLDDHPLFPAREIPFLKWVADYYIFPLGETIKAALPTGLERKDVSCVFMAKAGRAALARGGLTPGEVSVLERASRKDGISLGQLVREANNPAIRSLVRKMERDGLVTVSAVLKKETASVKQETFVRPGAKIPEPGRRLSKKRREILAVVA